MARYKPGPVPRYAAGILLTALACLLSLLQRELVHPMLGLPFFSAVILTLWAGGPKPAILAAGLSSAALAFLLTSTAPDGTPVAAAATIQVATFAVVSLFMISRTAALQENLAARRKAEERWVLLENLIATMPDGFYVADAGTSEIIIANRAMHAMAGYGEGELVGKPVSVLDAGASGDPMTAARAISEAIESNRFWEGELRAGRKDGAELITHATLTPYEQDGRRYVAILQTDITARRRAEEALRRSEEQFRTLVDAMEDMVFTVDTGQRITSAFGRWLARQGLAPDDLTGRTAAEIFGDEAAAIHQRANMRVLAGESVDYEWTAAWPNETQRYFHTTLSPLRDAHGTITSLVGVTREVTERKRLEERLRQAYKMDAIGRLAGGVAHDFNNLLTVITGYSQMMIDDLDPHDPMRGYAESVLKAGNRATVLTNQLLAFSGRQIMQPEVLDVNVVVRKLDPVLRRFLSGGVSLQTALAPDLGRVQADPAQVEHIIMNLAANARDAMPGGGTLRIETANVVLAGNAKHDVAPGPYVMLAIRDTGTGMSSAALAHLFEPFFSTKGVGKGTGLGLSSVYGIVKQNGGDIVVDSEPGRGTGVKVYLPRVEPSPAVLPAAGGPYRGTETILVVEDEAGVRALAVELLRKQGYTVLQAANGPEALEIGEKHSGRIHLLLSELVMPLMSGQELVQRFAALRPDTRVLYMTAYPDDAIASLGVGPELRFVQKPFTAAALATGIRNVLDSRGGR